MRKTIAATLLAIIAICSLGVVISSASAMGASNRGWGWNISSWKKNGDTIPFQRSWIRLNGIAETYNAADVAGALSVNARTVGEGEDAVQKAFVTAIWRTSEDENTKSEAEGNWINEFYSAKLLTVDASTLGPEAVEDPNYVLDGTWKVAYVTIAHTETRTEDEDGGYTVDRQTKTTVDVIEDEAEGTLTVSGDWKTFTLLIEGGQKTELTGSLTRTRMSQMAFNRFKLSEEDDTEVVSRVDLKVLAKNFGARPGWGSYDGNMDFNCNYKIDIADLATVAVNVES